MNLAYFDCLSGAGGDMIGEGAVVKVAEMPAQTRIS